MGNLGPEVWSECFSIDHQHSLGSPSISLADPLSSFCFGKFGGISCACEYLNIPSPLVRHPMSCHQVVEVETRSAEIGSHGGPSGSRDHVRALIESTECAEGKGQPDFGWQRYRHYARTANDLCWSNSSVFAHAGRRVCIYPMWDGLPSQASAYLVKQVDDDMQTVKYQARQSRAFNLRSTSRKKSGMTRSVWPVPKSRGCLHKEKRHEVPQVATGCLPIPRSGRAEEANAKAED